MSLKALITSNFQQKGIDMSAKCTVVFFLVDCIILSQIRCEVLSQFDYKSWHGIDVLLNDTVFSQCVLQ